MHDAVKFLAGILADDRVIHVQVVINCKRGPMMACVSSKSELDTTLYLLNWVDTASLRDYAIMIDA